MKRFLFCRTIVLLIIFFTLTASTYSNELDIRKYPLTYFTEIYPPSSFHEKGQLVGVSVDMLKALWRQLDMPEQEIFVVPWARGYKEVTEHRNRVLFAMSKTQTRAPLFKWVGPIFEVNYVIASRQPMPNGVLLIEQLKHLNIVVIRNDITEILVKEAGIADEHIVFAKSMAQSIKIIDSGRVDLIAISRSGLRNAMETGEMKQHQLHEVFHLETVGDYYAFSKDTPDIIVRQFQQGLDQIKLEQIRIRQRYGVDAH